MAARKETRDQGVSELRLLHWHWNQPQLSDRVLAYQTCLCLAMNCRIYIDIQDLDEGDREGEPPLLCLVRLNDVSEG